MLASTSAWVTKLAMDEHPLGRDALDLARALDGECTPGERAALSRELRFVLDALRLAAPPAAGGALARIRAQRNEKLASS